MFFRFAAALLLIVLVSMAGVMLEKQILDLRRAVSRQYYQTDLLIELHVKLRLETQQLTSPSQLAVLAPEPVPEKSPPKKKSRRTEVVRQAELPQDTTRENTAPRIPLLRFQRPFNPEGID